MIETFPDEADHSIRLKRARMRAWRRGMREMDLILGGFIDAEGVSLDAAQLTTFEALMARRDQDLYDWLSGKTPAGPDDATTEERALVGRIASNWNVFEKNSP